LGELPNNLPSTILNEILRLNPNIDINCIRSISNITSNSAIAWGYLEHDTYIDNNGYAHLWHDTINVSFSLKQENIYATLKRIENHSTTTENKPIKETLLTNQKIFDKFNNLSKEQKQQKLNEINQHYQNLSKADKAIFKKKLEVLGTSLLGAGISAIGTKIIVGSGGASGAISAEGTELVPLLSASTTENLAVAETVTAIETTAVEGTVLGAEAATSLTLAPGTLGLSLVIGGLTIAGTSIIWWINSDHKKIIKHKSHNQYNEIEKYYKFLAHDQLKLGLDNSKWNKIKEMKENSNNYQDLILIDHVPKIMCFIDKTGKYFLVGLDMYFNYWIYNTRDNNKYRLTGYQAIRDTAIKELHYLTVAQRKYEKEQATNPFLSGLTYQQARKQICAESDKLKAEYQSFIQKKYSVQQTEKKWKENNSLVDNYNTHYEKNKGEPPEMSEEELSELLVELDNLD
ncbi:hypothetical protein C6B38_08795, partial [Spiroplasma sp. ChiS]